MIPKRLSGFIQLTFQGSVQFVPGTHHLYCIIITSNYHDYSQIYTCHGAKKVENVELTQSFCVSWRWQNAGRGETRYEQNLAKKQFQTFFYWKKKYLTSFHLITISVQSPYPYPAMIAFHMWMSF